MRYLPRILEAQVRRAARNFPAVVLTGPRRAGKTSLLRHLLPHAEYFLLEVPLVVARLRSDPHGFLDAVTTPAIFDELQNVPETSRGWKSISSCRDAAALCSSSSVKPDEALRRQWPVPCVASPTRCRRSDRAAPWKCFSSTSRREPRFQPVL